MQTRIAPSLALFLPLVVAATSGSVARAASMSATALSPTSIQTESTPTETPSELAAAANAALARGDQAAAIAPLEALIARTPQAPGAQFQLGMAYLAVGRPADAIAPFQAVSGPMRPIALYNVACAKGRLGEADAALAALTVAVDAGFYGVELLHSDSDLALLQDDPRLQDIVDGLERALGPAVDVSALPPRAQFDWMVGEWQVAGSPSNPWNQKIQWEMDGQVLQIRSSQAITLLSYVADEDLWRMSWVSRFGDHDILEGGLESGQMVLHQPVLRTRPGEIGRSTYANPRANSFTLEWDVSTDGGTTWARQTTLPMRRVTAIEGSAQVDVPAALEPLAFRLGHWHTELLAVRPGGVQVAGRGELEVSLAGDHNGFDERSTAAFDDFLSYEVTSERRFDAASERWTVAFESTGGASLSGEIELAENSIVEHLRGVDARGTFEDQRRYELGGPDHWRLVVDRTYADGGTIANLLVMDAWRRRS
ncbi:TPR end-of-group domain-containing protein [Engelhardtia mirabilis]|uniref:Tetratricopeptide repeat protein n=1 Tax=Engelhardtia mirabilis TaxID=2528011 RepID=A0A518BHC9_9BACT|nr:hypothetical protein Pla133_14630 [Planctomycetes bacterium Pla133]QDV00718.1 hypothetical protein Pla86_14620 [Planctomycetes bacterium Pla86]